MSCSNAFGGSVSIAERMVNSSFGSCAGPLACADSQLATFHASRIHANLRESYLYKTGFECEWIGIMSLLIFDLSHPPNTCMQNARTTWI